MPHSEHKQIFHANYIEVIDAHRRIFIDRPLTCDLDEDSTNQNGGIPSRILRAHEQEDLMSFTWPASILALIIEAGDHTEVSYRAEIDGWGPIQQRYIEKFLNGFVGDIMIWISNNRYSDPTHTTKAQLDPEISTFSPKESIIDQLKKLAELKNQGILTEAEFSEAKAKIISKINE